MIDDLRSQYLDWLVGNLKAGQEALNVAFRAASILTGVFKRVKSNVTEAELCAAYSEVVIELASSLVPRKTGTYYDYWEFPKGSRITLDGGVVRVEEHMHERVYNAHDLIKSRILPVAAIRGSGQ